MTDIQDDIIDRVRIDRSRLAKQQRVQLALFVIADVLGIASIVGAVVVGWGFWIVAGVFALIALIYGALWANSRKLAGMSDDELVVFELRRSGIGFDEGLRLTWDQIDRVEVAWTGASIAHREAGESAAQATGRKLAQQVLAANDMDNAVRRIDVVPVDYAALRAAATKEQELRFVDPALGRPGLIQVHLGQAVDEQRFADIVTKLQRETEARGKQVIWLEA